MVKKIAVPFLIFLATLGLVELGCRALLLTGVSPVDVHRRFDPALSNIHDVRKAAESAAGKEKEMSLRLLSYGIEAYEKKPRQETPSLKFEAPIYLNGEKTGVRLYHRLLPPGIDDTFRKIGADSKAEKFRFHMRTNAFHRRDSEAERRPGRANILFYGCSFTFGEGVNEDETIPWYVSGHLDVRGFNFGSMGAGPADFLANLEGHGDGLLGGIPEAPTSAVYTFIDDHLRRVVRTSFYLTMFPDGIENIMFYSLGENGELSGVKGSESSFTDFYWFRPPFGHSAFAKVTGQEIPWITEYHYRLFAKILARQRQLTMERVPQFKDFFVAFFPGETFYVNRLRPYLEAEGLKVLDYSFVGPGVLNTYDQILTDGHPSPDLYRLYSWLLAGDLQKFGFTPREK